MKESHVHVSEGYALAILIFVAEILRMLLDEHYFYHFMCNGVKYRGSLIGMIYRKVSIIHRQSLYMYSLVLEIEISNCFID